MAKRKFDKVSSLFCNKCFSVGDPGIQWPSPNGMYVQCSGCKKIVEVKNISQ